MLRSRRVESTSPEFSVAVISWDEETGNGLRIEYGADGSLLRHAIATRFPRDRWQGDVIGETVWYDEADRELRREPVHLGRAPFESS
ncbi:MAG TPA: hypothetical protein VFA37_01810 [Gaiellaceae bacterium]|nr:hypothetical protein [Gaiellaceae bacterium]